MQSQRVAIHLHAFYPELVSAFVERISLNTLNADLFVSVPDEDARNLVVKQLDGYKGHVCDVKIVPNRGRDIGPLLTAFGAALVQNYDIIGHFHAKASKEIGGDIGRTWYHFILENLLGGTGGKMADRILGEMTADSSLGLVFPDDPNVMGWTQNWAHAQALAPRLGLNQDLPNQFNFPVGNMFWAKTGVLIPFVDLDLSWNDYPEEPLAYDGTILHAIERLLPMVTKSIGLGCKVTNVEGIGR
jgi:lipopolysaccharide biosynthesis protein